MKINNSFVLRKVAQTWVILPLADENVNFNGMMTLNDSAAMLWHTLEQGADRDDLVKALTSEYAVSVQQAQADVDELIQKLHSAGCIDMQ